MSIGDSRRAGRPSDAVPVVVVADPLSSGGLELLGDHAHLLVPSDAASLPGLLADADALVVRSRTKVTAELLGATRRMRLIGRAGIGVDNIDVPAATARGILVVNAPLGNVRSTAEHTVALIFALARRIPGANESVRRGNWKAGYEGVQLAGKRLGLLGAGKVGRQVAAMAQAIGMNVLVFDPYLRDEDWTAIGLPSAGFEEVLETSDFITIHIPLEEKTRGFIGAAELGRMRPGSFLVNCARGGLVDEAALVDALRSGHLSGAALDVFEVEPLENQALLEAPNLILTPHVAASTREAQAQVSLDIARQVIDFFNGRPPAFPINPSVLEQEREWVQV